MWLRRQLNLDGIVWPDFTSCQDDAHNSGPADFLAGSIAVAPQMLLQTGTEVVDFAAGRAQARDFDNCGCAEMKSSPERERQHVEVAGEDVFAEIAWLDVEAFGGEFVEHFGGEEMDLAKVRLRRVAALEVEVLNGHAPVGVAFHAFAGDQADRRLRRF